ncbi:DNA replication terminus site-binding protein [Aliivibrio sp. S2TY2]|uniref:DNA replication terminus site-binding protein n=1 Tax=Aliivibrio wodanis TaxID=80852 RepID=A0A5Q4ZYH3_9GAMM|nr:MULTISPECIES: DNA replication terminus site-binding protein [Aliivibrio]MDD9176096.1 DNA replication terminus site-binding protein [Aliivibrio sp. S3TY1]MDD9192990.1 DNA replication terminus site-binding protein [Aliivibrio sp. S2TY2]VVV06922.1 DNA replication terminus site-binding protein [Aliivibrio wodanis]
MSNHTEFKFLGSTLSGEGLYDYLLSLLDTIEAEVLDVSALIRQGEIVHAEVACLPVAEVTEDGIDTIHHEIETIYPTRLYGNDAIEAYLRNIQYQYKHSDLSPKGARRCVGIIHVRGSADYEEQLKDKIHFINQLKLEIKTYLSACCPTSRHRQKFYQHTRVGVLPKTVTRKLHLAKPDVAYVSFSWLNKGYLQEKINYKRALDILHKANASIAENRTDLDVTDLNSRDEVKLSPFEHKEITWIRPSKLNPRFKCSYYIDEGTYQDEPIRATSPLLIVQRTPLKRYKKLDDFRGVHTLAKVEGLKRVKRTPIIEYLGMYSQVILPE